MRLHLNGSGSRTVEAGGLKAGDWVARVRPDLGGAITALEHRGRPILRPTPEGAGILDTACFPLVPYANRIADGGFEFEGRTVRLPVLDRFAPHALHGDGWLNPWRVEAADEDHVVMGLDWPGAAGETGWPWPWRAEQAVALSDEGLAVRLVLTNTGDSAMPAGLGLHPYFVRPPEASLRLTADGVWLTDGREIPFRLAPPDALHDWSDGRMLASAPFVDHAYSGWTGEARITGADGAVNLKASSNARWVQVYAPRGADFLCVEPVTHRPDAIHAPDLEAAGLVRLSPGEKIAISLTIGVTAA